MSYSLTKTKRYITVIGILNIASNNVVLNDMQYAQLDKKGAILKC